MAKYLMQTRSSADGLLKSWLADTADYAGTSFPGPGTAQDVALYIKGPNVAALPPPPPTLRMGEVATRIGVAGRAVYGGPGIMAQTWHSLRSDVTALRISLANWYVPGAGEVASGGALTLRCGVESVGGAFSQGTVSGNPAPLIASGGTAPFIVPFVAHAGDKFFIRHQYLGATIPFAGPTSTRALDLTRGDAFEFTTTDKTMSGTVIDGGANITIFPMSCQALTANGWINIIGDSRAVGSSDSETGPDATGNCGEIERPFGGRYAYANLASAGESAAFFIASGARRAAQVQPGAIVICQIGINDIAGAGATAATLAGYVAEIRAMLPSDIQFWTTTMPPVVTTSDNLTTLVGQTPYTNTSERLLANAHRLANPEGYTGCLDIAAVLADAGDPTRWKVDGTPFKYAFDDRTASVIVIHETTFANKLLSFSSP